MSHNPNPFDFVPFPSAPILRKEEQFDALGEKFSGYLEIEIKALTPVHVMGRVEDGATERKSSFFRHSGLPCIPASTIKGCLRAFTEALTAGWVSRANTNYPKEFGERHVGFNAFESYDPKRGKRRISPPAIDPAFKPKANFDKLDVATYLFGTVIEGKPTEYEVQSRKSKVWVEDAYLPLEAITFKEDWWAPDIGGGAFMGGAKPSASNWWYFEPARVWKRNLPGHAPVAEFVGEKFRGRKFYFHQNPVKCIQKYDHKKGEWIYSENKSHQRKFHPVRLECMAPGKTTLRFRIYLDGVPQQLLQLLKNIIQPGEHICHKLGYAKAYGYGSIEFAIKSANLRPFGLGIPEALELRDVSVVNWDMESLARYRIAEFIDLKALTWLARILSWQPHEDLLFMYPQYRAHEFKQPIRYSEFGRKMAIIKMPATAPVIIRSHQQGRAIAESLWDLKRPIDFRLYQEKAEGWDIITRREP